jgi:hypothetical protein
MLSGFRMLFEEIILDLFLKMDVASSFSHLPETDYYT